MNRRHPTRTATLFFRRWHAVLRVAAVLLGVVGLATAGQAAPGDADPETKTIAMIGAGNMGQALGNLWAAAGYQVIFATRNPDELDTVVATAGHGADAATVGEALDRARIVVLAVPYGAEPLIAEEHGEQMEGKILVDVDNAFPHRDGEVAVKAEAVGEAIYSARLFAGTRFIRAFNLKGANSFPEPGDVDSADYDMPYTTNDESVRPVAEALIRAAGGTPVYEGGLENAREY